MNTHEPESTGPESSRAEFEIISRPEAMVDEINQRHESICHAASRTVQDAVELGKLLEECRKSIGHGDWMEWVKRNLKFGYKTASRYIAVHRHRDQFKLDTGDQFELTEAYELLNLVSKRSEADEREAQLKAEAKAAAETRREEREEAAGREAMQTLTCISPGDLAREQEERESKERELKRRKAITKAFEQAAWFFYPNGNSPEDFAEDLLEDINPELIEWEYSKENLDEAIRVFRLVAKGLRPPTETVLRKVYHDR